MFINNIKPDGHKRRPPKRITRKPKGCALCDAGHHADGPRGHHVDGRWLACQNQSQRAGEAPSAASDQHYDRAVKKVRNSKPPLPPQAALVPAEFLPEQRIVRPA
jgi:hypothetical protein